MLDAFPAAVVVVTAIVSVFPSALSDNTSRTVLVSPFGAFIAPSLTSDFPSHFDSIVTAPP